MGWRKLQDKKNNKKPKMEEKAKFKGVWIDSDIWLIDGLKILEKHFLQKIKDLDNEKGCYANNAYFSSFFGVSKSRCTQIIKKLEEKKAIKITLIKKGKAITNRVINFLNTPFKKLNPPIELTKHPIENTKHPYLENSAHSNIEESNTIKEYKERVKRKEKKILSLQKKIEQLEKENLELKNKKEKEKKEVPAEKKESRDFPKKEAAKKYDIRDKRLNKHLPFDILATKKTLDYVFPTLDLIAKKHKEITGRDISEEFIKEQKQSFIEKAITNYQKYKYINSVDLLISKFYGWLLMGEKHQNNNKNARNNQNKYGNSSSNSEENIFTALEKSLNDNEFEPSEATTDFDFPTQEY